MTEMPYRPVIRRQRDLEATWRHLMGRGGFDGHSLWLMVILPDDRPFPHLLEIDEATSPPGSEELEGLSAFLRVLVTDLGEGSRVAFLRSRPGRRGVTDDDRAWAGATYDACRRAGVAFELTHLATQGDVLPIPPDDLPESASA
jgi:hypothetical protein